MDNIQQDAEAQRLAWASAVEATFDGFTPAASTWTRLDEIVRILSGVCRPGLNHTLFPQGGGQDTLGVVASREEGCIELAGEGANYLAMPVAMHFEHFPDYPADSFFFIENADLDPTPRYGGPTGKPEELLRLAGGMYADPLKGEYETMFSDNDGNLIPPPKGSRYIFRIRTGPVLIVAKKSLWNMNRHTYKGNHAKMTPHSIRELIEVAHAEIERRMR